MPFLHHCVAALALHRSRFCGCHRLQMRCRMRLVNRKASAQLMGSQMSQRISSRIFCKLDKMLARVGSMWSTRMKQPGLFIFAACSFCAARATSHFRHVVHSRM
jgi:hypothetical protein